MQPSWNKKPELEVEQESPKLELEFLSEHLAGPEYTKRLREDIANCSKLRFLVAYVSKDGVEQLGFSNLIEALDKEGSFGVSSLACVLPCMALLNLQKALGANVRLKYFLEPSFKPNGNTYSEPRLSLLHSKLVYLKLPENNKSVVYIGSHNWTKRALGMGGPKNAEASIRIEIDFHPDHELGEGDSIAAQVNRHLRSAFDLPACFEATAKNRTIFSQWRQAACEKIPHRETEDTFIIVAVLNDNELPTTYQFNQLKDQGIYLRTDNSGRALYEAKHRNVILMLWRSEKAIAEGKQPILFRCIRSSDNPDPSSDVPTTNIAASPIEGFGAIIYDNNRIVKNWAKRHIKTFDFEFRTEGNTAEQVDNELDKDERSPQFRFHLDIQQIAFPADLQNYSKLREAIDKHGQWARETFAVAKIRDHVKFISVDGYEVSPERKKAIANCFKTEFGINKNQAKVWPTSESIGIKAGNFQASHPLHETFMRENPHENSPHIEHDARMIIPKLEDDVIQDENSGSAKEPVELEPINQLTKGVVKRLDNLFNRWKAD
ncbi:hypothetical protein N9B20_01260 [Mariniblastus sp.]|nr:hypothetical protein [Mariniblastus sp.]